MEKPTAHGDTMKKILALLTPLLLLASCSQEELGTPFYAGQEVSISAAFSNSHPANNGKKRISGKDNVDRIDLTWDEGDKILVTVGDKSAVFTLSSGAGTNNATFTGTMPADGSNFHVSYPIDYTDEVLTNQTYTANGFGKGLMKMSTKIPGTLDKGFTLSADNALLGLKLQGDANVSKIVLTNNDNQKTYTLDCSTQTVNTTEGTLFYIVVPAGTWANGLKVEVYNSNGIVIEERTKTSQAEFVAGQALMMPEVAVHDYVDLGLSVKWATCNVGATTPEDYGDYFAWGETEPKTEYTWANYKWCDGTENKMTKYNATDGLTTLLPEDDAAHVNWGGGWRMPTGKEMKELCEYCTWIWETHNEINGYRIVGQNGNSIFLPAGGFQCIDGFKYKNRHGDYWSSSRAGNLNGALHPSFLQNNIYDSNSVRYYGFPIRPVLPKN